MPGIVQPSFIGGLGNQMFIYAAVRSYAERIDAKFECPYWVGKDIFGLDDPLPTRNDLPIVNGGSCGHPPTVDIAAGQRDVMIADYFQTQTWVELMSRATLKRWFRVQPLLVTLCGRATPLPWYIAAHMRQADYIGMPGYANLTEASYLRACEEHHLPVDKLIWAKQDTPRVVPNLHYNLHFMPDFLALIQADVILRANSTFSWWAAVLSNADVYSPVVDDHTGWYDAPFVRGNWPRNAHTDRVGLQVTDLYLPD